MGSQIHVLYMSVTSLREDGKSSGHGYRIKSNRMYHVLCLSGRRLLVIELPPSRGNAVNRRKSNCR